MITTVPKGVDAQIEFKGFYGSYFYQMAGSVLGAVLLTFILYIIGFNSILVFVCLLAFLLIAFVYIKFMQEKYGRYGRIHASHKSKLPQAIILNKDFKSFIQ